jgi:hypothetical protein
MLLEPVLVYLARAFIVVRAVKQNDAFTPWTFGKYAQQIGLCTAGFSEDDRFFFGSDFSCFGKCYFKRLEKRSSLGVVINGECKLSEAFKVAISCSMAVILGG